MLTDTAGTPVDPAAIIDGQQLYVDARSEVAARPVTVTASAPGSSATGKVITLPTTPGGVATPADHGQSLILVAAAGSTTDVAATASWAALAVPAIGTTATTDDPIDSKLLPAGGGTVTDAVAYSGLTPGTVYTLRGELYRAADGTATGITGSTVFTPTTASGSVDVVFSVPAGFAGESLVTFEWLYAAGSATSVAQHTDITDGGTDRLRAGRRDDDVGRLRHPLERSIGSTRRHPSERADGVTPGERRVGGRRPSACPYPEVVGRP